MKEGSRYLEITYGAIPVFADDGTIDMEELNFLLGLALKDGEIDDDERRVLGRIFDKVSEGQVTSKVWARIREVRAKYAI